MRKRYDLQYSILMDIVLINISIVAAYFLRFGRNINMDFFQVYLVMAPFVTVGKILIFYYSGLYKNLWKYAGVNELGTILFPIAFSNGLVIIFIYFLRLSVPRSIYIITTFIDIFIFGVSRFGVKIFKGFVNKDIIELISGHSGKRVMIIGAGEAGGILIQEMKNYPKLNAYPVCAIDDNTAKQGRKINGVPIVGGTDKIVSSVKSYNIEEIIICIPSISNQRLKEILEECEKTSCKLKIVPFLSELREMGKEVSDILLQKIRDVDINDLLGREEVRIDNNSIVGYIRGKRVLVSGGGGSIGSELCRQIQEFDPARLVVLDISEANLYEILDEFRYRFPHIDVEGVIASVRDQERLKRIFDKEKPDIVFHAAAHKHVHFMESNPEEAVKNNVFGTLNIIKECHKMKAEKFILISTDKAVNPTNVMGATKRLCELLVQAYDKISETQYVAVRFGNVLGSSGSVIPLFKKQIERGGPVTVTHPDVVRYFMTIPEAAQLVVQAGAMAHGGEIFILDMGEPVKIDKLARDLIKLSGFEPDVDINVVYTGLRPGEKLFEELTMSDETVEKTLHKKIFIAKPVEIDIEKLFRDVESLKTSISASAFEIKNELMRIVPTYEFKDHTGMILKREK